MLDCGIGNVKSVAKMLSKVGGEVAVSSEAKDIKEASAIIFPGVGSFDNGIRKLKGLSSFKLLEEQVLQKSVPFLGICVGMQLLFESSEEGSLPGLGWVSGNVVKFKLETAGHSHLKIPHMGWNEVAVKKENGLLVKDSNLRFYFVHSFHANNVRPEDVMSHTTHGYEFVSSVVRDNIYGVQFHPEKSHKFGLQFFKRFLSRI